MINALSIDLEFWYSGVPYSDYLSDEAEEQIEEAVIPLLNLLNKYNTYATFFVLGIVAEKFPSLIKMIYEYGHEISSHSYSHKRLCLSNERLFENEIKKSIELLKSITGKKPIGFRAPSFSIDNSTRWAFEILKKYGFKYDSSIFPIKTRLYGVPDAPLEPYAPSMEDITKIDKSGEIVEFPLSVIKVIKNIPISGGYYFRILPFWFLKTAITKINRERPVVIYIHPWETYPETPRLNLPFPQNFIAYYGIRSSLKKFEKLLQTFYFSPIRQVLNLE
jgi:polysaccharide deacetylase family protein (PEP-CTERM system associated)